MIPFSTFNSHLPSVPIDKVGVSKTAPFPSRKQLADGLRQIATVGELDCRSENQDMAAVLVGHRSGSLSEASWTTPSKETRIRRNPTVAGLTNFDETQPFRSTPQVPKGSERFSGGRSAAWWDRHQTWVAQESLVGREIDMVYTVEGMMLVACTWPVTHSLGGGRDDDLR